MDAANSIPIVWSIAGSDSGGGAGIQADLKVMSAFGLHGCSVTTALTAQNTLGVHAVEPVSGAMLQAQLEALASDLPPAAIKTGMLGSAETCRVLTEFLESATVPVICDPVLKSTSGEDLLDPAAFGLLIAGIFPHAAVLTPNLPEARQIIGEEVTGVEDAAERILETGAHSVLIKGGHTGTSECRDYWTDGEQSLWIGSPRIKTCATHGTGCILSAAIASAIAGGQPVHEAVITAKTFLNQCLRSPADVGSGHGPMMIQSFRNDPQDRPTIR
jgi:hydroxymethylpyrimidine kinase/phosphomethylpyrimidine kinase